MSSSARKRSSMSLNATTAPRPSSMSIGAEVRDRELRAVAPEEQSSSARDRLARRAREEHRELLGGTRTAIRVAVVDRLVAVAPEQLVGALVAQRCDRRGVREADQASGSTTQTGCATVCRTAARKSSAPTFQPPRSVREPGTRSYEPDPGQRHRQDCGRPSAATARRAGITPGNKLSATEANSGQLEALKSDRVSARPASRFVVPARRPVGAERREVSDDRLCLSR